MLRKVGGVGMDKRGTVIDLQQVAGGGRYVHTTHFSLFGFSFEHDPMLVHYIYIGRASCFMRRGTSCHPNPCLLIAHRRKIHTYVCTESPQIFSFTISMHAQIKHIRLHGTRQQLIRGEDCMLTNSLLIGIRGMTRLFEQNKSTLE